MRLAAKENFPARTGQKKKTSRPVEHGGFLSNSMKKQCVIAAARRLLSEKIYCWPQGFFFGLPPELSLPASLNSAFTALRMLSDGFASSLPVRYRMCSRRSGRCAHSAAKAASISGVVYCFPDGVSRISRSMMELYATHKRRSTRRRSTLPSSWAVWIRTLPRNSSRSWVSAAFF